MIACPNCGTRNPDEARLCLNCQEILSFPRSNRDSTHSRRCRACGAELDPSTGKCASCEAERVPRTYAPPVEREGDSVKILMYVLSAVIPLIGFLFGIAFSFSTSEEKRHLGVTCAAIAFVPSLTALSMYSLLTSPRFESAQDDDGNTGPPAYATDEMYIDTDFHSVLCEFSSQSMDISWDDITITLSDEGNATTWNTTSAGLTGIGVTAMRFPGTSLGNLTVWCNVTDMGGDGLLGSGDAVYLSTPSNLTFSSSVAYLITITHETLAVNLYQATFWGGLFGMVN